MKKSNIVKQVQDAVKQVQEYATITLKVVNAAPKPLQWGGFEVSFYLYLKVDTGSGVGEGKSQKVDVIMGLDTEKEASRRALAICEQATKRVNQVELTHALLTFPLIIADLATTENEL